jgi:predicted amino acid dehydrogenase
MERANPGRLSRAVVTGRATLEREGDIKDFRPLQPPPEEEVPPGLPQVTFLTHFIEPRHLIEWDASLAEIPAEELERYVRQGFTTLKPFVIHESQVVSTQGSAVHLRIVCFPKTSAMIEEVLRQGNTDELVGQIREAIEDARRLGSRVIGLGGYLSIVAHNCLKVATTGVSLTTGNALTVAMGLEAIKDSCKEHGIDLTGSRLAVVGATGNIGQTYTRLIAEEVSDLVLVGRTPGDPRLAEVARQLYADAWECIRREPEAGLTGVAGAIRGTQTVRRLLEAGCPDGEAGERLWQGLKQECPRQFVRLAYDLGVLAESRVIITATNSAQPIIYPEHLAEGRVVICDLAVPADVSPEVTQQRPDVTVLRGGIVRLPENAGLTISGLPLPPGHLFACLAETVLLGLEGHQGHYSFGPITREQVVRIGEMADRHGYEMGQLQAQGVF